MSKTIGKYKPNSTKKSRSIVLNWIRPAASKLGKIGNSLKVAVSIKQKPVTAGMGVERDFDFTL